jgi:hypothetical protein
MQHEFNITSEPIVTLGVTTYLIGTLGHDIQLSID